MIDVIDVLFVLQCFLNMFFFGCISGDFLILGLTRGWIYFGLGFLIKSNFALGSKRTN